MCTGQEISQSAAEHRCARTQQPQEPPTPSLLPPRCGIYPKCKQCPWTIRSNRFFSPVLPNPTYLLEPDASFPIGTSKKGWLSTFLQSQRWQLPSESYFVRNRWMQFSPVRSAQQTLVVECSQGCFEGPLRRAANFAHLSRLCLRSGCRSVPRINSALSFVCEGGICLFINFKCVECASLFPPLLFFGGISCI